MKLPSKEEVKRCVQSVLTLYAIINGFSCTYLWIWKAIGLPIDGWTFAATTVLGVLSGIGLIYWIVRD